MEKQSLMTIFAHQDDETFSAGGILAKYATLDGAYAVTVTADPKREKEFVDACDILGAEPIQLPNTAVNPHNINQIKQQIIEAIRKKEPSHIITHLDYDYHHEHRLVREIVTEAVEWVSHTTGDTKAVQIQSLWAAETTILIPFPQIFVDISPFNDQRMKAITCYESQSHKGGDGFYSDFHGTRTKLRGIQAAVEHAEAYVQIPIAHAGSFKPTKVFKQLPY